MTDPFEAEIIASTSLFIVSVVGVMVFALLYYIGVFIRHIYKYLHKKKRSGTPTPGDKAAERFEYIQKRFRADIK